MTNLHLMFYRQPAHKGEKDVACVLFTADRIEQYANTITLFDDNGLASLLVTIPPACGACSVSPGSIPVSNHPSICGGSARRCSNRNANVSRHGSTRRCNWPKRLLSANSIVW